MQRAIFLLILFSTSVFAQGKWDYREDVKYSENHDPSMVWLADGRKLEVIYGSIPWEEVQTWSKGRMLILGYRIGVGTVLYDVETKKELPVVSGMDKHPLDLLLERCLEENWTTRGMIECYGNANNSWDLELNAHYKRLMATLNSEQKASLRKSQIAWIKFKDAQLESIGAIYDRDGTMWGIVRSQQAMSVTRDQALRLNSFSGF